MAQAPAGWKKPFDYHLLKAAVNGYLHRNVGGDVRPVFHDIDEVCPNCTI